MLMTDLSQVRCWICEARALRLLRDSTLGADLTSSSFAITDANFGVTGELSRCGVCGFIQCTDLSDVVPFYEDLEDPEYDRSWDHRIHQARRLVREIRRYRTGGKLLDVGAGVGMLVDEARRAGFVAEGIEPSRWMQARATERGLPVRLGTLDNPVAQSDLLASGPFDVVTLIDVIEHVEHPVGLLEQAARILAPGGIVAVVTPDVGSVAARLLGGRWWHFRTAHVGYFDHATLTLAGDRAGLELIETSRPSWTLAADYLWRGVCRYLPAGLRLDAPAVLGRVTVPLNLYDSILAVFKRSRDRR
jgi:SAM-dependent methyltransferase